MARLLRRRFLVATLGLPVALAAFGGAGFVAATEVVPAPGGSYVEGVVGAPSYINPILSHLNEIDEDLVSLVFSGLTRLTSSGDIVPDLALDWQISSDRKVYTFRLRRDVRWQDGQLFSSDDVVFTINAIQDPDYQGSPALAALWKDVAVAKVDSLTVRMVLRQGFAPFLEYTSQKLLPAHVLASVPAKSLPDQFFNARPVGTGPFRIARSSLDSVVLEPAPGYHGNHPFLGKVEFRYYSSAGSALEALRRREVQGLRGVPAELVAAVKALGSTALYTQPEPSMLTLLILNTRSPLFGEKGVRQAMAYAIDRNRLIEAAYGGQAVIAPGPISSASWAFKPDVHTHGYHPGLARELLAGAGWIDADGSGALVRDGKRLEFALLTNNQTERIRAAEEIARQLALVGIKADVQTAGWVGLVQDFLAPRKFEAVLGGQWSPNADPDPYPFWHSSQSKDGLNLTGWSNGRADALLEAARRETDRIQRAAMYYEFQDLFADEIPSIPLVYPLYNYAVAREVKGVQLGPLLRPSDRLAGIVDWYVKTKRVPRAF